MDASNDYSKLKVPELKKLLKDSGLATSGNKAELIARLQEASGSGDAAVPTSEPETNGAEQVKEEPSTVKEEEKENENNVKTETTEEPTETTSPTSEPKKVKLVGGSDADKLTERAQRFGAVSEEAKKALRAEKFGIVSDDSKKEKRAERFNISSPEDADAKKAQRAARFGIDASNTKSGEKAAAAKTPSGLTAKTDEEAEKMRKRAERFGTSTEITVNPNAPDTDKLLKRKMRFGGNKSNASGDNKSTASGDSEVEEKKRKRAERFKTAA